MKLWFKMTGNNMDENAPHLSSPPIYHLYCVYCILYKISSPQTYVFVLVLAWRYYTAANYLSFVCLSAILSTIPGIHPETNSYRENIEVG